MIDTEQVTSQSCDGVATVCGTGDLNLYVVEPFTRALSEAVSLGGEIVVDFRQASFIDTAFVVALVAPARALMERGSRLKVLTIEGAYPQYVLKIVGFADLMDIVAEELSTQQ